MQETPWPLGLVLVNTVRRRPGGDGHLLEQELSRFDLTFKHNHL